ncbi:MAG: Crp/Fnr family transcriptional regulator [Deltaproteobacteria bacterium]|nr:Crp/Fnr family transcriptional regulator [Deltaproteobacteria bacterium]
MGNDQSKITELPLLMNLKKSTVDALVERGRRSTFDRKGLLLSSEDLSSRLFLILEGKMKVLRPTSGGEESLQQRLISGDIFCPAALILRKGCCSYAESLTQVQLLSWPHRQFRQLMDEDDQLHRNLIELLAHQIEEERTKRCLSQCINVRAKVATFLISSINQNKTSELSTPLKIDLRPISLTAQELGIARETMSRTLSKLEQLEIITCQRGLIDVHDSLQLQLIADGLDCNCCRQRIKI